MCNVTELSVTPALNKEYDRMIVQNSTNFWCCNYCTTKLKILKNKLKNKDDPISTNTSHRILLCSIFSNFPGYSVMFCDPDIPDIKSV